MADTDLLNGVLGVCKTIAFQARLAVMQTVTGNRIMSELDYQIASIHQIHQDITERLNRYRIHLELTQQELADEAGISVPTLSRLFNGKGATLDTFLRVLNAMKLTDAMAAYIPEPRDSPLAPRRAKPIVDRQRVRAKTEVPVWTGFSDTGPVFDDKR
jgi:transcriptional regulator with XRE-family HTH domain